VSAIERRFWYALMFLGVWTLPTCCTFRHGRLTVPWRNPYFLVVRLQRPHPKRIARWYLRRIYALKRSECGHAECMAERANQRRLIAELTRPEHSIAAAIARSLERISG